MLVCLRAARSSALLMWRKHGGDRGNKVDLWPCIWLHVCGGLEYSQGKGWWTQCPGFRGEEEEKWEEEDSYGVSQSSTEVPPLAAWLACAWKSDIVWVCAGENLAAFMCQVCVCEQARKNQDESRSSPPIPKNLKDTTVLIYRTVQTNHYTLDGSIWEAVNPR